MGRSEKQKASAEAYKLSLKRQTPVGPPPEPPKESWWTKPDFYEEAKEQVNRQKRAPWGTLPPVNE